MFQPSRSHAFGFPAFRSHGSWFPASGALALLLLLAGGGAARAATYTADELFRQYNIIAFEGLTLNDEVEGRVLTGGDLRMGQAAQVMFDKTANQAGFNDESVIGGHITGSTLNVQNGSHITVGGNVTNQTLELNGHGTARIGGTLTANANQGTKLTQQASRDADFASRFPTGVEAAFRKASIDLAGLSGVAAEMVGGRLVFGATPASGTTVYEIDFATLSRASEYRFDLNGAETVVINVTGTSGTLAANFVTGDTAFEDLADRVVWNFTQATSVKLERQMWGYLMAPLATVNGSNTNYEGGIAARQIATYGEMHSQQWKGTLIQDNLPASVPVPAALPLLAAALGGLAVRRRRRG